MATSPSQVSGGIGVALVSTSGYATIYNVTGQATFGSPTIISQRRTSCGAAAFSPAGTQLALGGYDSSLTSGTFPLASPNDQPVISFSIDEPNRLEDVNAIAFSPNGKYVAVAGGFNDGSASVWDLTTLTRVGRYQLAAITRSLSRSLRRVTPLSSASTAAESSCSALNKHRSCLGF